MRTCLLFANTALGLCSPCIAAQEVAVKSAITADTGNGSASVLHEAELAPAGQEIGIDSLPDAPLPVGQVQGQLQPHATSPGQQLNQMPLLPPKLTKARLTTNDKFQIYVHKTFGPPAVLLPAVATGYQMVNPPSNYPRSWKDGASAFGRNYGYKVADHTSRNTAEWLAGTLLHEDPRYLRSTSTNPLGRTFHALAFTVVDKTDSGKNTLATSNFASAAAGGFVGMGILPDGYNDLTHAEQHMASEFLQICIGNVITEFQPEWGPWAKKIHLPKILPAWWVPEHPHHP